MEYIHLQVWGKNHIIWRINIIKRAYRKEENGGVLEIGKIGIVMSGAAARTGRGRNQKNKKYIKNRKKRIIIK